MRWLWVVVMFAGVVYAGQLSSEKGRYVYGQVSNDGFEYMLDTETGRLWRFCTDKSGDVTEYLLEQVPYIDFDGKRQFTPPDTILMEKERQRFLDILKTQLKK